MKRSIPSFLAALAFVAGCSVALAQQPAAPKTEAAPAPPASTITPAEAQRALDLLQDDKQRAQLIQTLETIAKAAPAPAETPAPEPASPVPALPIPLEPNGLGVALLTQISNWIGDVADDLGDTARAMTDFPLLLSWGQHTIDDPASRARLIDAAWNLALVLFAALLVEWVAMRLLRHPLRKLEQGAPAETPADSTEFQDDGGRPIRRFAGGWRLLQRLPFALARLALDLIPVAAFAAIGNLLLGAVVHSSMSTRLAIVAIVNAYALCRAIMCLTRMLVSPGRRRLALLQIGDETAAYIEVWARRILVVAIFGAALASVARYLGLYKAAHEALLKVIALIVHLFLIVIVLQCRRGVADAIRADDDARGAFVVFRNCFADIWHYIAIGLILASWVVWAVQVRNGLSHLIHIVIVTAAVLIAARLLAIVALGMLDRIFHVNREVSARLPGLETRVNRYYPLLRGTVSLVVWAATLVALFEVWGLDSLVWFSDGHIGDRLVSAFITVAIASIVAIGVWESANAAMDRHITRLTHSAQAARVVRLQTLLPMLRTVLMIVIVVVVGLTGLSQVGVNIAPLLAGAGIVGVAIGFGSQKLVQDLITGIFLLLENAMQVGDTVTVAGLSGTVEHLSIRTIRLRAADGSVHIVPFSAVSAVTNSNRELGNAAVAVTIPAREDIDRITGILKEVGAELRRDPAFKNMIRGDLEVWGIDKIEGGGLTIAGQIACTDSGRWPVQREFNRRIMNRFREMGIRLAHPTRTVILENPPEPPEKEPVDAVTEPIEPAAKK